MNIILNLVEKISKFILVVNNILNNVGFLILWFLYFCVTVLKYIFVNILELWNLFSNGVKKGGDQNNFF